MSAKWAGGVGGIEGILEWVILGDIEWRKEIMYVMWLNLLFDFCFSGECRDIMWQNIILYKTVIYYKLLLLVIFIYAVYIFIFLYDFK